MRNHIFRTICALTLIGAVAVPFGGLLAPTASGESAENFDLYISPDGNDSNSGKIDSPLKTAAAAKEKLKGLVGTVEKPVTVYLREGTYVFSETLKFTADDLPNVTYKAYEGERVIISGATPISDFTEDTVNGVRCFTKQLDTSANLKSLFNETESLNTPKYPETGYFTVDSVNTDDSLWTEETSPWSLTTGQRSFNASPNDVRKAFYNQNSVVVRILHYWHDEMMYVTDFDEATGRISLSRPSSMHIRSIDRYFFENVFEALNAPSEWYFDNITGKLYYVPNENEAADSLVLYGSALEQLVTIDGVDGISFENITFKNTDWNVPKSDSATWSSWLSENDIDALQAALDVKGVIAVTNAADFHILNCEFLNLGATAIKLGNGVHDSSVENCYLENIAATGIFAGGENVPKGEPGSTYNITFKNNEIYKYGRRFFCAIGIQLTHCDTAAVENNEIHDGFYTGISCGWTWGYAYNTTKNLSIKNNLIYNIGQGWLSDMGGIYMLGVQPGTVLSGNVIHNVAADSSEGGYGGWGIYLDEGSSLMTVEKNLVFCCGSQGINIHYGEDNIIRNNISALSGEGAVSIGLRDEHTATFTNNILLTDDGAPIYLNMHTPEHFTDNNNLMWNLSKRCLLYFCENGLDSALLTGSALSMGFISNPIIKNPLFADVKNFDFTLDENSPAIKNGFETWDYSTAGTLAGTTIGIAREGAQTAYAEGAHTVQYKSAKAKNPIEYIGCLFDLLIMQLTEFFIGFFPNTVC